MKCPHCGNEINVGALIGAEGGKARSRAKTRAARANAKLGGWPKGKKRRKRKPPMRLAKGVEIIGHEILAWPDANQIAHGVVAKAAKIAATVTLTRDRDADGIPKITRQGPSPRRLKVLPSPKSPKLAR